MIDINDILQEKPMAILMELLKFFTIWEVDESRGFDMHSQLTRNRTDIVNPAYKRREAQTHSDFSLIFEKEVQKLENGNTNISTLIKLEHAADIIKDLKFTISDYKESVERKHRTYSVIHLTNEFVKWLENECKRNFDETIANNKTHKKYSHKTIAIAYHLMGIYIDNPEKAKAALKEHSDNSSYKKLLGERITKTSELIKTSSDKTANTKHLKTLQAAEQLVSGKNNQGAINSIRIIISTFKANMEKLN